MGKISLVLFLFASSAFATTYADRSGQPQEFFCGLKARFEGVEKTAGRVKKLFWKVRVLEKSGVSCPLDGDLRVRVRGAGWSEEGITYPVHVSEPADSSEFNLRVRLIEGVDSLSRERYSEWTLAPKQGEE